MERFERLEGLGQFVGHLTPTELMKIFPIEKTYNGEKWKTKDYFSTMEVMNKLDPTQAIHKSIDPFQLLWDYQNWDLIFFIMEIMHCMSEVRQLQGHPSIMEEFMADMGVDTYTLHTDSKGKQYLYNRNTGKTMPVKPHKKRPFKVIKGNVC